MHKVLADTNVLLDIMVPNRPEADSALAMARLVGDRRLSCLVSAGSLKDVYYIGCKYLGNVTTRSFIKAFMELFEIVPIDQVVCREAMECGEPDFEDGIIRACAEREGADYILTRDYDAFKGSTIRSLSPKEYLEYCAR